MSARESIAEVLDLVAWIVGLHLCRLAARLPLPAAVKAALLGRQA